MKCPIRLFVLIAALMAGTHAHAAPLVELQGRVAADQWLKLVDQGQYGEAWAWCAPFFRAQIDREEFVKAIEQVRKPLGAVESRELAKMFYTNQLPNAPDAHYVVIQFKTKFANRAEPMIELITPMMINADGDPVTTLQDPLTTPGEWQVSGYYLQ